MKCPECDYEEDIRREKHTESDETIIFYYRCKDCGFQWEV